MGASGQREGGTKEQPEPERRAVRLESVDLLRGLVMVVMTLDHTRAFFSQAWAIQPTDLTQTTPALFLTRWVTHFCAPVFVFLAGVGAYLGRSRAPTVLQHARKLLLRGLWLVIVGLVVTGHLVYATFSLRIYWLDVIWASGWSMVVLSGLVYLRVRYIVAIGLVVVAGHNALDTVTPESLGALSGLWRVLHVPGEVHPFEGLTVSVHYPLIPWIGVMALGYGFGALLQYAPAVRRRWCVRLGVGAVALFVLLRTANVYGDLTPWSTQRNGVFTLLSWLNCTKYPPSLCFLLMTLGPAVALFPLWERGLGRVNGLLLTLGRVPLFYFIVHVAFLFAVCMAHGWAVYGPSFLDVTAPNPPGYGYGLPVVYLLWLAVVAALYPVARWYAGVKRTSRSPWMSYL